MISRQSAAIVAAFSLSCVSFVAIVSTVACGPSQSGSSESKPAPSGSAGPTTSLPGDGTGDPTGAAASSSSSSSGAPATLDGADAGVPIPECGSLGASACTACCNIAFPDVQSAFESSLASCICGDPGECSAACGTNYCQGGAMSSACSSCILGSTVCKPATIQVCESEPVCAAYLSCLDECQ